MIYCIVEDRSADHCERRKDQVFSYLESDQERPHLCSVVLKFRSLYNIDECNNRSQWEIVIGFCPMRSSFCKALTSCK